MLRLLIALIGAVCLGVGLMQGNVALIVIGAVLLAIAGIYMFIVGDFGGVGGDD